MDNHSYFVTTIPYTPPKTNVLNPKIDAVLVLF